MIWMRKKLNVPQIGNLPDLRKRVKALLGLKIDPKGHVQKFPMPSRTKAVQSGEAVHQSEASSKVTNWCIPSDPSL